MDTFEKYMLSLVAFFMVFGGSLLYISLEKDKKELELKYMAASAGAPLAVCVK